MFWNPAALKTSISFLALLLHALVLMSQTPSIPSGTFSLPLSYPQSQFDIQNPTQISVAMMRDLEIEQSHMLDKGARNSTKSPNRNILRAFV